MIEGTKSYRRKNANAEAPSAEPAKPAPAVESSAPSALPSKPLEEITPAAHAPEPAPAAPSDAVNLERRAWFASLVPAFGDGLVKLIRASNNLQRDLHETLREGSDALVERERRKNSGE